MNVVFIINAHDSRWHMEKKYFEETSIYEDDN